MTPVLRIRQKFQLVCGHLKSDVWVVEDIPMTGRLRLSPFPSHAVSVHELLRTSTEAGLELDADGIIRAASPGIASLLGWKVADVIGRPLSTFIYQDDRQILASLLDHVGPPAPTVEVRVIRHRRNRPVALELSVIRTAAAIRVHLQDVLSWRVVELALRGQSRLGTAMADGTPTVLLRLDQQCRCVHANSAWGEATGTTVSDEAGLLWLRSLDEKTLEAFRDALPALCLGTSFAHESLIRHLDGSISKYAIAVAPIVDENRTFSGFLFVGADLGALNQQELSAAAATAKFAPLAPASATPAVEPTLATPPTLGDNAPHAQVSVAAATVETTEPSSPAIGGLWVATTASPGSLETQPLETQPRETEIVETEVVKVIRHKPIRPVAADPDPFTTLALMSVLAAARAEVEFDLLEASNDDAVGCGSGAGAGVGVGVGTPGERAARLLDKPIYLATDDIEPLDPSATSIQKTRDEGAAFIAGEAKDDLVDHLDALQLDGLREVVSVALIFVDIVSTGNDAIEDRRYDLKILERRLRMAVREHEYAAPLADQGFVVAARGTFAAGDLEALVLRIMGRLSSPLRGLGQLGSPKLCVGGVRSTAGENDAQLIERAERARTQAVGTGPGSIVLN